MIRSSLLKSTCTLAALAAVLSFAPSAAARNKGHRFLGTIHGGAAGEAGGGVTAELRVLDDICIGAGFDLGVNLLGTYDSYRYYGPAVHGSFRIGVTPEIEIRPFFGARFPLGIKVAEGSEYTISDAATVAFTTSLRVSYIYDIFVFGIQGDFTPHAVTWQYLPTGKTEDQTEYIGRASLVFGVALGPYSGP
jgi:hypothetical protein